MFNDDLQADKVIRDIVHNAIFLCAAVLTANKDDYNKL